MEKPKKTKSGKWRVRVAYYEAGKRKMRSFTSSKRADVIAAAIEYDRELENRGTYDDLTLAEAYKRYIDSKEATLSPSTVRSYRASERHDFPMLKPMKLKELTPELIQTAISELSANRTPKTVRNKHGLLSAVLKAYMPSLHLNTNLPQKEVKDIIVPTAEEVRLCIDHANDYLKVPILLASTGSLRRSEICALTPSDVTDVGVLVNKAAVYDDNRQLIIKQPKSTAGHRFCPLPPDVIMEVKKWKHFGLSPSKLGDEFIHMKNKLSLKFTFHGFRHYFASELHSQGVPDKYIAKVGGWRDVSTLQNIYQHTLRDREKIFEDKIVNIFSNALSSSINKPDIKSKEI